LAGQRFPGRLQDRHDGLETLPSPLDDPLGLASPTTPSPAPSPDSLRERTGREIYPIDLGGALRLAGARDLDIAIARERIAVGIAELQGARVLWLPSLFIGPNWNRFDGQMQDNVGEVFTANRSSAFIGATASAGGPVFAPPPGGGTAPVSSFAAVLRISDAIFIPLAAQQVVAAREARLAATTNDILLDLTETYFGLQQAAGRVAIAREALGYAETLVDLTAAYVESGRGLEADYRRSRTELERQRQLLADAVGQMKVASAELVRRTRLDPRIIVAPVEPPEAPVRVVPAEIPLDDLIVTGLTSRPELAEAQALVRATILRLRQARLRPLIPSLALRYSAGGFGGGPGAFFGNFDVRHDADANIYWELLNFGLGDRAIMKARAAEQRIAAIEQIQIQDRVAAEVAAAYEAGTAAEERRRETDQALSEALRSLALNLDNIRDSVGLPGAPLPIEVLQPIQALAQARLDHLDAVLAFNRAQFRLYRALGRPPGLPGLPSQPTPPGPGPLLPPGPVNPAPMGVNDHRP
jgi:outer membrane protein TolC